MPVVIPELVWVVGLFFAVVGYLMARGSLATYTHSIGYLLKGLESVLKFSAGKGWAKITVDLGGPVRALDHAIVTALQNWCDGAEIQIGYCLHGMAKIARYTAQAIDFLARETADTFDWLVGIHLPKLLRYALTALFPLPFLYRTIRHLIAAELPKIARLIHAGTHEVTTKINRTVTIPHLGELQWIHRHWKALTAAVAGVGGLVWHPGLTIPRIWHGIDELRHRLGKLERRVTKTEALFGATALSIAMANVLGIPNPRCLRDGPIGKVARRLCGMPSGFLNDLLGLLADFFILENVCVMLPWVETAASEIGTPLVEVLTVVGAGICQGSTAPAVLRGPTPSVPALIFGVSASGV